MNSLIVGVDLGGTNTQIGVVDARGEIVAQIRQRTHTQQGAGAIFERLVQGARQACQQAGAPADRLVGVGLAAAAAVDSDRGVILDAPNLGWRDFPVAGALEDELGAPVVLENDVNAALVGEHRFGAVRGENDVLGVWVGTGVGGAILLDGALHRGALGTAGEIGHMTLFPHAPQGARTLEDNCSRSAVARRLASLAGDGCQTSLNEPASAGAKPITAERIAQAYARNDALTREVVDEAADLLGVAIAGVVTLLSIPVVALGGGLVEALGEPMVRRVRQSIQRSVFPRALGPIRVVEAELKEKAGILGVAALARDRLSLRS